MREMSRRHIDFTTAIKVEYQGKQFTFIVDLDANSRLERILYDFFELPPCCVYHRITGMNSRPCAGINEAWEASLESKTCIVSADGKQEIEGIDLRGKRGYGPLSSV